MIYVSKIGIESVGVSLVVSEQFLQCGCGYDNDTLIVVETDKDDGERLMVEDHDDDGQDQRCSWVEIFNG